MKTKWKTACFPGIVLCILFAAGVAFAAVTLPEKLKDIPVYQGAAIKQAMDMDKTCMAIFEITASAEDVFEFYKKALPPKGWKVNAQMQQEKDSMLHCQKGNAMLQVVVHDEGEGKITCSVVLNEQ